MAIFHPTEGDDRISGDGAADRIRGRGGDDTLRGAGGPDKLYGEAGADSLSGGAQADRLYGGSGSDTIRGGDGNDLLYGDTPNDHGLLEGFADVFVFDTSDGRDRIADFEPGLDQVVIELQKGVNYPDGFGLETVKGNAVFSFGGTEITFLNIEAGDLGVGSDIVFVYV